MPNQLNTRAYADLFVGGIGLRTALGGLFARFYIAMATLGSISMYVQSGYSYVVAGAAASVIALSNFIIAPQVSRLIDRHGQSKVIPPAMTVGLVALAAVLLSVHFHAPVALSLILSIPMGSIPMVQSITRTRWSYMLHREGTYDLGRLKTAFSFEGVLDDVAFMLSPALAIALSAWFFPEAGMLFGGICYLLGMLTVLSCHESEPDVAFMQRRVRGSETAQGTARGHVFRSFPLLIPLFGGLLLLGMLYGFIDPATYAICDQMATSTMASVVFFLSSIISVITGLVFGMLYSRASPFHQLMRVYLMVGILYLPMALVFDIPSLFAAHIIGAFSYAPFVITINAIVERVVDPSRVTESLTLTNSGMSLGMAFGPTLSGLLLDTFGSHASFIATACCASAIIALFVVFSPYLRHRLPD